ncbi:hypothetical protein CKAN_01373400 [Cinnamomum micranthum f. kanehirae]|uniref:Uncharacterized protein n=1 Tax=Cinnamomum micranthum f. kanehirae TaxID=337451 RepID=A0A443P254_9MAGN|nr:hypothetical protein CKAN_01373400 [Cinnamomum micranthum f. kanehirae]
MEDCNMRNCGSKRRKRQPIREYKIDAKVDLTIIIICLFIKIEGRWVHNSYGREEIVGDNVVTEACDQDYQKELESCQSSLRPPLCIMQCPANLQEMYNSHILPKSVTISTLAMDKTMLISVDREVGASLEVGGPSNVNLFSTGQVVSDWAYIHDQFY